MLEFDDLMDTIKKLKGILDSKELRMSIIKTESFKLISLTP